MPRYFVFDTNALISAHLKADSISALAFDKALDQGIVVVTEATLREFATRFARRKFDKYLPPEDRIEAIVQLSLDCLFIKSVFNIKACRDPDDDMFLSQALAVDAACIITGDRALLELDPFRGIPILPPSTFLKRF